MRDVKRTAKIISLVKLAEFPSLGIVLTSIPVPEPPSTAIALPLRMPMLEPFIKAHAVQTPLLILIAFNIAILVALTASQLQISRVNVKLNNKLKTLSAPLREHA